MERDINGAQIKYNLLNSDCAVFEFTFKTLFDLDGKIILTIKTVLGLNPGNSPPAVVNDINTCANI